MLRFLSCVLCAVFVCVFAEKPKYVFMFIGDGMSIPQRTVAEEYLRATGNSQVIFNHFPVHALTRTSCANQFVTDSAASGTALACGEKTNYKSLGVATDGVTPLESSAVVAKKKGMKVGIITSVTINHATPAAFYAHRKDRGQYYEIGLDMIASGFDYFAGGNMVNADDKKCSAYAGELHEKAREAGYRVADIKKMEDLEAIKPSNAKTWLVATASGNIPFEIDAEKGSVRLADYLRKGIELLDNPNGFFIMCEGGAIDYGGHDNDPGIVLGELLGMEKAVRIAFEFAQKHPEETLIVVTGDHETGGLSFGFANTGITGDVTILKRQTCSARRLAEKIKKATADPTVGFADIQPIITESFGLKFSGGASDPMVLKPFEVAHLEQMFQTQYRPEKGQKSKGRMELLVLNLHGKRTGLVYSTNGHSALPVVTSAYGAGAQMFAKPDNGDIVDFSSKRQMVEKMHIEGGYENTEVSRKIKAILK